MSPPLEAKLTPTQTVVASITACLGDRNGAAMQVAREYPDRDDLLRSFVAFSTACIRALAEKYECPPEAILQHVGLGLAEEETSDPG